MSLVAFGVRDCSITCDQDRKMDEAIAAVTENDMIAIERYCDEWTDLAYLVLTALRQNNWPIMSFLVGHPRLRSAMPINIYEFVVKESDSGQDCLDALRFLHDNRHLVSSPPISDEEKIRVPLAALQEFDFESLKFIVHELKFPFVPTYSELLLACEAGVEFVRFVRYHGAAMEWSHDGSECIRAARSDLPECLEFLIDNGAKWDVDVFIEVLKITGTCTFGSFDTKSLRTVLGRAKDQPWRDDAKSRLMSGCDLCSLASAGGCLEGLRCLHEDGIVPLTYHTLSVARDLPCFSYAFENGAPYDEDLFERFTRSIRTWHSDYYYSLEDVSPFELFIRHAASRGTKEAYGEKVVCALLEHTISSPSNEELSSASDSDEELSSASDSDEELSSASDSDEEISSASDSDELPPSLRMLLWLLNERDDIPYTQFKMLFTMSKCQDVAYELAETVLSKKAVKDVLNTSGKSSHFVELESNAIMLVRRMMRQRFTNKFRGASLETMELFSRKCGVVVLRPVTEAVERIERAWLEYSYAPFQDRPGFLRGQTSWSTRYTR